MSQQQCDINRRMGDMQLPITSAAKQNTYRMMKHSEIDSLPGETYSKSIYVEQVFDYLIIYTHRTLKELVIRASALKTGKCQFWTFPKILPLLLYPVFYSSDTVYLIQTQHSLISPGVKTISFPIMTLLPVACHRLDQGFPNYWDGETRVNLYPLPPAIPTCPTLSLHSLQCRNHCPTPYFQLCLRVEINTKEGWTEPGPQKPGQQATVCSWLRN